MISANLQGTRWTPTDRDPKRPPNARTVGGRELRYVRDVLPRASNAIVAEALRYECDVIAFEESTHIRDRTEASCGHKWAFRTLYEQVEYKAEAVGVSVKQVGSACTSKRCAECGFTAEENRSTRNDFRCMNRGSEADADYRLRRQLQEIRYPRVFLELKWWVVT